MRLAVAGPGTAAVAVVAVSAAPALQFRNWQWLALALTAAVVLPALGALRDAAGRATAAGAVAALAWSVAALLQGAGAAGLVQAAGTPVLALDAAAVLGALLLLPRAGEPADPVRHGGRVAADATPGRATGRDTTDRIAARTGALVVATAVAALGFRLGAGAGAGAAGAAAAAVLIAGCPCALLLLPVPAEGPYRLRVRAEHGDGVLRAAAALHTGAAPVADRDGPADPVGRAVAAAARRRYATLPGRSDVDGDPASGLRGVVSELAGETVFAHAVLAGPPEWLSVHGVDPPPDAVRAAARGTGGRGTVWCVAWDGEARGWLELVAVAPPGARRRQVAVTVTVVAAGFGAGAAALGTPAPAAAGAVPVGAALLVTALRMIRATDRAGRSHPVGATAG